MTTRAERNDSLVVRDERLQDEGVADSDKTHSRDGPCEHLWFAKPAGPILDKRHGRHQDSNPQQGQQNHGDFLRDRDRPQRSLALFAPLFKLGLKPNQVRVWQRRIR